MTEYRKRRRGRRQYRPSEEEKERIRFRLVGRLVRAAPESQRAFPARQMTRLKPGE